MSKIMLVNVTHVEETRVAILNNGILCDYEIETINRTHIKGNIHNAVVESVHPSLEAAFVRIGPDLKGFLPLDEVNFRLLPARSDSRKAGKIGQHLHQGQKIMAQVVREPYAGKPPTISTYFSLPGRYLVLMPGVDSSGISRKIDDSSQRDRLKKIIDELKPPEGFGLIVRTAGLGQTKVELQRDLRYLLRLWESIQRSSGVTEFPGLVYREADLVIRTIRDHLSPDISEVWIDSKETYEKALEFVRNVMPNRSRTLKLYTGDRPQFNKFNLEEQIEKIYKRRVPLPSGGEIVIDGTEALTAIDVNTARSKRKSDLEESALQTNLEAADEVARQLRLRDLGGLVVIDFIDMLAARNRSSVEKAMRDALRGDKARYDVTRISKLGLMEIARQRIKGAKMAASYATCPVCDGHGLIKNIETAALSALRKLQSRVARGGNDHTRVVLPPEVATWLLNNKREELLRLEQRHQTQIEIEPKASLLRHDSEFVRIPREKTDDGPATAVVERRPSATAEPRSEAREPRPAPPVPKTAPDAKLAVVESSAENGNATASSPGPPVKPAPAPAEAPTDDSAAATAGSAAESTEPRPRRRRRRRRKPANADGAPRQGARPDPAEPGEPAQPAAPARPAASEKADDVEVVPRSVRADELMPAASGGSRRSNAKGAGKTSGGRRRRRTSGPKS